MRFEFSYIPLLIVLLLIGCGSLRENFVKNIFSFSYEGNSYQIISFSSPSGEGTNYLSLLDENEIEIARARDLDQNGSIDMIITGDLSLNQANTVYITGISIARKSGFYKEQSPLRSYHTIKDSYKLILRSYYFNSETFYNLLIIQQPEAQIEAIYTDNEADGELDSIESGEFDNEIAQQLYDYIIQEGKMAKRIKVNEKGVVVTKHFKSPAEPPSVSVN